MRDPYQILGVAKTASEAEIKKAFRGLAKKHHPDTHPGDEKAKQRFQEISGAYDILGDKDKRAKFDAGEIDASGNARGFDPRTAGAAGGFRGSPFGGGGDREFHFSWDNAQPGGAAPGGSPGGFSAEDISRNFWAAARGAAAAAVSRAAKISAPPSLPLSRKAFWAARGGLCCPMASRSTSRFPPG